MPVSLFTLDLAAASSDAATFYFALCSATIGGAVLTYVGLSYFNPDKPNLSETSCEITQASKLEMNNLEKNMVSLMNRLQPIEKTNEDLETKFQVALVERESLQRENENLKFLAQLQEQHIKQLMNWSLLQTIRFYQEIKLLRSQQATNIIIIKTMNTDLITLNNERDKMAEDVEKLQALVDMKKIQEEAITAKYKEQCAINTILQEQNNALDEENTELAELLNEKQVELDELRPKLNHMASQLGFFQGQTSTKASVSSTKDTALVTPHS